MSKYTDRKLFIKGNRKAEVQFSNYVGKFTVHFYYDGFQDFEWKRGSDGVACDLCDTYEQACRKARYYVRKA